VSVLRAATTKRRQDAPSRVVDRKDWLPAIGRAVGAGELTARAGNVGRALAVF
jgi:hypothetical protein